MPHWLVYALLALGGYCIGTLSPSVLISTTFAGFDVRTKGSGNAGTTNVLRTMGWLPGVATFIGDLAKGALPTLAGLYWGEAMGIGHLGAYVAGGAVLLGHAYPAFNHFKGGKCVASTTGVWLVLCPIPTIIVMAVALSIMFLSRRVSVGSLAAAVAYPAAMFFLPSPPVPDKIFPWFCVVVGLFVIFLHRTNIKRLLRGEEKALRVAKKPETKDE